MVYLVMACITYGLISRHSGLCTLKQLSDAGITHLKLVGRGNYTDFMERDIRNLRRTLEILEDSSTEEEYIRAMKAELFPNGCSHMCYAR